MSDIIQDHDFLRTPVVLHHISSFGQDFLKQSAQNILKGLLECMKGPSGLRNEIATSPDFWSLLQNLRALPDGAPLAFRIIEDITAGSPPAITADNYEAAVDLLNGFGITGGEMSAQEQRSFQQPPTRRGRQQLPPQPQPADNKKPARSDTVLRGVRAMTILQHLTSRIPPLIAASHLPGTEAWHAYFDPVFRVLCTQCTNPCREIRQSAFTTLQRTLLSPDLIAPSTSDHKEWTSIFPNVLNMIIYEVSRPDIYNSDRVGMEEMRAQTAGLICRIWLQYLSQLADWEGYVALWKDILETMEGLLSNEQRGEMAESLPESIKNILLVMSSGGYLVPPPARVGRDAEDGVGQERSETQRQLWDETYESLERFLPGLMGEIFPAAPLPPHKEEEEKAAEAQIDEKSRVEENDAESTAEKSATGEEQKGQDKEVGNDKDVD